MKKVDLLSKIELSRVIEFFNSFFCF